MGTKMKVLALDLGDKHTGVAISDALGITSQPLTTLATALLNTELGLLLEKEGIESVVVGYPKTLRGTISKQTETATKQFEELKKQFPKYSWHLWDERLTSKSANSIMRTNKKNKKNKKPKDKLKVHAVAAALILQSYLEYLKYHKDA